MTDNERDTKFLGFAKLLYQELSDLSSETIISEYLNEKEQNEQLKLIAQHAYDLACHVLDEAPITEYEWDIHNATDLTEWPTTPE